MRTCKFYSPSQAHFQRQEGLEMAVGYEYDRPFNFSECSCPSVRNGASYAACGYENEFGNCIYYAPEELRPLRSVVVTREDAELPLLREERLRLGVQRRNQGLPSYYITVETLQDTETGAFSPPVVVHVISGQAHGPLAKNLAEELFEKEIQEERSSYPHREDPAHTGEKISYIETVVAT